jgi:AAA15 family ATPase/GTPase
MARKYHSKQKNKPAISKADESGRHFSTFSIKNFRCFKSFTFDSIERINLIGGMNNAGKTTLLETIFLLLGTTNIRLLLNLNAFRGMESMDGNATSIRDMAWAHLFHNYDNQLIITINGGLVGDKQISITLKETSGQILTIPLGESESKVTIGSSSVLAQALQLQYKNIKNKIYSVNLQIDSKGINFQPPLVEPLFPGIFLTARRRPSSMENASRYGQLDVVENQSNILTALKIIEPRLKRLSTIVIGSVPMIHGDIGIGRMLPLAVMGDGLGSLASLLLAISSAAGGVVLIDEIENGLHYSVMVQVWKAIAEAARHYDTQIFATTHSWECIESAHEAFLTSGPYDFRYHRLEQKDDTINAVTFDQSTLQTTIESGWEVR